MTAEGRIEAAVRIARETGQVDGAHHKAWTIDQMVRALLGDEYTAFVQRYRRGGFDGMEEMTDGEEYDWDEGIPA